MTGSRDPRIDAYIARAKPFARPILKRVRAVVHRACPTAQETMKWSMPFFTYRGTIMLYMAAFSAHAACGFWHRRHLLRVGVLPAGKGAAGMGSLGKLVKPSDLPSDAALRRIVKAAARLIERGASSPLEDRARRKKKSGG